METLLYVIFFVSCLVLVVAVLLQPGKTDAGALFTSGVSSAALNPRGTQSVLSKITIAAAAVFMISALLLSLPALTGNRSVLESGSSELDATANANTNVNTNGAAVNSNGAALNAAPDTEGKTDGKATQSEETGKESSADAKKDGDSKPEDKSGAKDDPKGDKDK